MRCAAAQCSGCARIISPQRSASACRTRRSLLAFARDGGATGGSSSPASGGGPPGARRSRRSGAGRAGQETRSRRVGRPACRGRTRSCVAPRPTRRRRARAGIAAAQDPGGADRRVRAVDHVEPTADSRVLDRPGQPVVGDDHRVGTGGSRPRGGRCEFPAAEVDAGQDHPAARAAGLPRCARVRRSAWCAAARRGYRAPREGRPSASPR